MPDHSETASLGITPYTGSGLPITETGPDSSYYNTPRYKDFQNSLTLATQMHETTIITNDPAIGIYNNTSEPSTAISIHGPRHCIETIAQNLGQEYDQYAVRIIYTPGNGTHLSYTYDTSDHDPEHILDALNEARVPGGRIINGKLEITNTTELEHRAQETLTRHLGTPTTASCEIVRIITAAS